MSFCRFVKNQFYFGNFVVDVDLGQTFDVECRPVAAESEYIHLARTTSQLLFLGGEGDEKCSKLPEFTRGRHKC